MHKAFRADGKTARFYSFIPSRQLPQRSPHKLDAFFYRTDATKEYASNDVANLRVVPLLLTADMKAHAEVGLVS